MFTASFPSNRSLLLRRGPHRKRFYRIVDRVCVCWTVYRAVAWQRVDQICYTMCSSDTVTQIITETTETVNSTDVDQCMDRRRLSVRGVMLRN
jgi:hypothetical protein